MKITISKKLITVNGKRASVYIYGGPWVSGVPSDLIEITSNKGRFPAEIKAAFEVTNNSNFYEDYFEKDTIKMLSDHPLYSKVKAALQPKP